MERSRLCRLCGCLRNGVLVLLVPPHVPLEEAGQWPQDAQERLAGYVEALGVAHGIDAGLSGLARQQGNLAEVVALVVLHHLHLALLALDASHGLALLQDEHLVVLLILLDDGLVVLELLLLKNFCKGRQLTRGQHLEDLHALEELHARLELGLGAGDDQVPESRAVQGPDLRLDRGCDCGRARGVVEEGKLAEGKAHARLEDFIRWIIAFLNENVEATRLDNVEEITDSPLLNDMLAFGHLLQAHCVHYLFESLPVNIAKQHVEFAVG
mmetsp:Transcript_93198/g.263464  ORF Transcript_93198/g.263464 Transcript_93198/m.263464 type:complete len:269 (-) Transcript_93198:1486-2292(-)